MKNMLLSSITEKINNQLSLTIKTFVGGESIYVLKDNIDETIVMGESEIISIMSRIEQNIRGKQTLGR